MYTQVSFSQFLERPFAQAKAEHGIEFDEYPNVAVNRMPGDWLHEIQNGFNVRLFRWPPHEGKEVMIAGPDWNNLRETREEFEARFEIDFTEAVRRLSL